MTSRAFDKRRRVVDSAAMYSVDLFGIELNHFMSGGWNSDWSVVTLGRWVSGHLQFSVEVAKPWYLMDSNEISIQRVTCITFALYTICFDVFSTPSSHCD